MILLISLKANLTQKVLLEKKQIYNIRHLQ